MPFLHKLESRFIYNKSLLCLGLDPSIQDIDEFSKSDHYKSSNDDNFTRLFSFCQFLINETKDFILCVKPNLAFFIQYGEDGIKALREIVLWLSGEIPVILDAKFGDISNTMNCYSRFAFDYIRADALTINMYMGLDVVSSATNFQSHHSVFILSSTSNKSADEIQSAIVNNDKLFLHVIKQGDLFSSDNNLNTHGELIGYVIGATQIDSMKLARSISESWFLVPGIGAQQGDLSQVIKHGLRSDNKGLIISVSRGISRSKNPRLSAKTLYDEINRLIEAI